MFYRDAENLLKTGAERKKLIRRSALWLASILVVAVATHVAWSAALTAAVHGLYDHRMFNVRKVEPAYDFVPFADDFLRSKSKLAKSLVIVAGASLTFGFDFSDRLIFSRQLARRFPDATVLNLSVIGSEGPGIAAAVTCAIHLAGVRPDLVILELPVINDAIQTKRRRDQGGQLEQAANAFVCPPHSKSLLWYFLQRPRGTSWAAIIRDNSTNTRQGEVLRLFALDGDYVVAPDAYSKIAEDLVTLRAGALRSLRDTTPSLVVYPGPLLIDELAKLGFDRSNIERQVADTLRACEAVKDIHCLDSRKFSLSPAVFNDVSHLNPQGHAAFGNWLADRIAAEIGFR